MPPATPMCPVINQLIKNVSVVLIALQLTDLAMLLAFVSTSIPSLHTVAGNGQRHHDH